MIKIHERLGNFSHILETFDSHDEAAEYLENRVRDDMRDNESLEDLNNENLRELYFDYYHIEEVAE